MSFPIVWLIVCIVAAVLGCLYFRGGSGDYELMGFAMQVCCCIGSVVIYSIGCLIWLVTK